MVVLTPEVEKNLKEEITLFPLKSATAIAKSVHCTIPTVSKYRKLMDVNYDKEFVQIVAGKWIKYFGAAAKAYLLYITQLEESKSEKKKIITKDGPVSIPLNAVEKAQITRLQADIWTKLTEDAGNGEVREVIRMMRSGKIPIPT